MSDSLIQSDLSELVIGLSSEHSYREITPTHTHTRAQFFICIYRKHSSFYT